MMAKALDNSAPITAGQARTILTEYAKEPLASPLIEVFLDFVDLNSLRLTDDKGTIYASANDPRAQMSIMIRRVRLLREPGFESVVLVIYACPPENVAYNDFDFNRIVRIRAGILWEEDSGIKIEGRPRLYNITVEIEKPIVLPSRRGRWLLGFLQTFSVVSSRIIGDDVNPLFS